MMLKPIDEIDLSGTERITAIIRGWVALDTDTGAFLSQTSGRGKGGLPKYILILPNKSVAERGGLFASYQWDYPKGRKFIRAWTLREAVEAANIKLARMVEV